MPDWLYDVLMYYPVQEFKMHVNLMTVYLIHNLCIEYIIIVLAILLLFIDLVFLEQCSELQMRQS